MVEILSLLCAAVVSVILFNKIGFGAVLGYLVAGTIIGPSVLGLVHNPENIRHIGEFGVVFLLFLIGIEIKPARLWIMRKSVFGIGGSQVMLSGAVIGLALFFLFDFAPATATIVGLGLALSSTAFAIQAMADKNQLVTHWGRTSFSILLLQDLAVVPLLILVPILASDNFTMTTSMGLAVLESLAIFVAVIIVGRIAINPLLRLVARAKSKEVFAACALLLVLGTATIMELAGLSMAMGAFIAGILLSESEYRHQIEADIEPFRGLLLGLFFMSVGMSIELPVVFDNVGLVLAGTFALLALKSVLIIGITRVSGLSLGDSIKSGFLLCQAGEFGFVLFSLADQFSVIPDGMLEPLVAIIVLSMAITPGLIILSEKIAEKLNKPERLNDNYGEKTPDDKVIIAGYGRVGRTIGTMLSMMDVHWVAVEMDVDRIALGRASKHTVYFGDIAQEKLLHSLGAAKARLIILTIDNAKATERAIQAIRYHYPDLPIVVRAHNLDLAEQFTALGATHVVPEVVESSIRLGMSATDELGVDDEAIKQMLADIRADNYAKVREI